MNAYNVLDKITVEVQITANPYDFEPAHLFEMAMRINKNRSFLFVSKVLGKHLAVAPQVPILISHLLAHHFLEVRQQQEQAATSMVIQAIKKRQNLQETLQLTRQQPIQSIKKLTIIGFAETATALGHAFFEAFTGDVQYIHTTREQLVDRIPTITFEEEHSHASSHRLYADSAFFAGESEIVLVDDEMTTGKTNINIIKQLHAAYPHIKVYTLVSILDWRSEAHQQAVVDLANELMIEIHSVSLMQGNIAITTIGDLPEVETHAFLEERLLVNELSFTANLHADLIEQCSADEQANVHLANYYKGSGRFALTVEQHTAYTRRLDKIIGTITAMRTGEKCLVLGTGEFMYTPMYIAAQMGENVFFHSTTRSPIYAHKASLICNKIMFKSPEYPGVTNYLYNISQGQYDDIVLIFERILDEEALLMLVGQLQLLTKHVHVITLGGNSYAKV